MVNLEDFTQKQTAEVQILNPKTFEVLKDTEGNVVKAIVHGSNSERFIGFKRSFEMTLAENSAKNPNKSLTQSEIDDAVQDLIIACVERIDNLTFNGEPIDNPEVIQKVLKDKSYMWLYTQIKLAADNISNFI